MVVVPAYSLLTAYASHLLLGARFFRERKKDGVDNNEKETKWRVWKLRGSGTHSNRRRRSLLAYLIFRYFYSLLLGRLK